MIGDPCGNVYEDEGGPSASAPLGRWRAVPARVRVEEQITTLPASVAPDPEGGSNPGNDWLLRGV